MADGGPHQVVDMACLHGVWPYNDTLLLKPNDPGSTAPMPLANAVSEKGTGSNDVWRMQCLTREWTGIQCMVSGPVRTAAGTQHSRQCLP